MEKDEGRGETGAQGQGGRRGPPGKGDLESLAEAFSTCMARLTEQTVLSSAPAHYREPEWRAVACALDDLERQADCIQRYLDDEAAAMPKLEALAMRLELQQRRLRAMEAHVAAAVEAGGGALFDGRLGDRGGAELGSSGGDVGGGAEALADNRSASASSSVTGASAMSRSSSAAGEAADQQHQQQQQQQTGKTTSKGVAPRNLVSQKELDTVPGYLGRQTCEKVNAFLEELARQAEANHRLVHQSSRKVATEEQAKYNVLLGLLPTKDERSKRFVVLEADVKGGPAMKSLVAIVRHLKRVSEIRGHKGVRAWELLH